MAKKAQTMKADISAIVGKAKSIQEGPNLYANHARISLTQFEAFIDLYQIGPVVGGVAPIVVHVQRFIIPLNALKGFMEGFESVISTYERDMQITLPSYATDSDDQPAS